MILASREAGFDLTKLASERTTVLESSISNTQLCIKRDTILDLFNELLKRLMDEQAKIKHTDLLRFWFLVSGFSDCRLLWCLSPHWGPCLQQATELALYNSYVQEKTDAHTAYVEAEAAFATAEKQARVLAAYSEDPLVCSKMKN
jgi:hypothetical protein